MLVVHSVCPPSFKQLPSPLHIYIYIYGQTRLHYPARLRARVITRDDGKITLGCALCNFIAILTTTRKIYPKFLSSPCYYIYKLNFYSFTDISRRVAIWLFFAKQVTYFIIGFTSTPTYVTGSEKTSNFTENIKLRKD